MFIVNNGIINYCELHVLQQLRRPLKTTSVRVLRDIQKAVGRAVGKKPGVFLFFFRIIIVGSLTLKHVALPRLSLRAIC